MAGIFIILHHKEGTEEKEILKNIYDTNLKRLDGIIKSNFASDMKQILLGEFKSNETKEADEKIEVTKRVIESLVESSAFRNNTILAEIAQDIYEIIQGSNYSGDTLARFYQTFLKY